MLTLGVDLSTSASQTAGFFLEWRDGRGSDRDGPPVLGLEDPQLLELMGEAERVGIDAPFGWPDAFRVAIDAWSMRSEWDPYVERSDLRYRFTDEFVIKHGRTPLSVSSDRIASTAMRCAGLLARYHADRDKALDRVGGRVVEVYPAAALCRWGFDVKGYKKPAASTQRQEMVERLADSARLVLSSETVEACARSDHALDAVVAALVARAQAVDLTHSVPSERAEQVAREGWICLPVAESLSLLGG
jgi:predicted nuclease with RNAse H fold